MKTYTIFPLLLISLFVSTAAFGVTFEVYGGQSIQAAISQASDGDTVLVHPGDYVQNINFMGKNITVISTDGPEFTTINGDQNGSVVIFENAESSAALLSGFSIKNGNGGSSRGGGVTCKDSSNPRLENLIITDNRATQGAGCYFNSSSPSLTNVLISENEASFSGGGIYCFSSPDLKLQDVIISGNTARTGGGIDCPESIMSLEEVVFSDNTASYSGGGLACVRSTVDFNNVTFSGNTVTSGDGGGIACWRYSILTLEDVTISGNTTYNSGGGVYCSNDSILSFQNSTISNNSASIGGALYNLNNSWLNIANTEITGNMADEDGGGIYCLLNSTPNLTNVTISGNTASSGYGGGMYLHHLSNANMENVTICNNSAFSGGGIYSRASGVSMETGAILNNTAENGGGLFSWGNSRIELKNVVIAGNTAATGAGMYGLNAVPFFENVTIVNNIATENGGGVFGVDTIFLYLKNSILWENAPDEIYLSGEESPSFVSVSRSDIQGGPDGIITNDNCTLEWLDGNIDQAPLFVDPENEDYHLTADSPCIDAGNPDQEYDDGCLPPGQGLITNDMGAYGGPGNCGWLFSISGSINYWHQEKPVPDVVLTITGDDSFEINSDNIGNYVIRGINEGNYTLSASKQGDVNGVQAYDAARVLQYSAGLIEFNEYQILAADVTGDGEVTSLDAAKIGLYAAELDHDSRAGEWAFLPDEYTYTPLDDYLSGQNFTAILYGDVTGNWSPGVSIEPDRSDAVFHIPDVKVNSGELATIPVVLKSGGDLIAFEGVVKFDPYALQFVKAAPGNAATGWNITASPDNENGTVGISAYGAYSAKEGYAICNFVFKVIGKGEVKIEFTEIFGNGRHVLMNFTSNIIIKR